MTALVLSSWGLEGDQGAGMFVPSRVEIAHIQSDQNRSFSTRDWLRQRFLSPGVGRLDQTLLYVQGGRLHPVAEQELCERRSRFLKFVYYTNARRQPELTRQLLRGATDRSPDDAHIAFRAVYIASSTPLTIVQLNCA